MQSQASLDASAPGMMISSSGLKGLHALCQLSTIAVDTDGMAAFASQLLKSCNDARMTLHHTMTSACIGAYKCCQYKDSQLRIAFANAMISLSDKIAIRRSCTTLASSSLSKGIFLQRNILVEGVVGSFLLLHMMCLPQQAQFYRIMRVSGGTLKRSLRSVIISASNMTSCTLAAMALP